MKQFKISVIGIPGGWEEIAAWVWDSYLIGGKRGLRMRKERIIHEIERPDQINWDCSHDWTLHSNQE